MEYWVYIDDPTDWARVHKGTCRYCNHGEGVKASRLSNNRWEGPFDHPNEAAFAAGSFGKGDADTCGHLPAEPSN